MTFLEEIGQLYICLSKRSTYMCNYNYMWHVLVAIINNLNIKLKSIASFKLLLYPTSK